jgi:hypothetical protein
MGAWTGAAADALAADAPADTSKVAMGAWMGAAADAPATTLEAATGAWTGAVADVPAATSEAPTMGISFFSITGVFSSVVEKMMGCDDLKFDNKFEVPVTYSTAIPEPLLRYT